MIPTAYPPQVLGIDQAIPNGNGPGATQRLSISEPVGGYTQYEKQPSGSGNNNGTPAPYNPATGQYTGVTLDIPVDQQRTIVSSEKFGTTAIWTLLNTNGTVPGFRIIYLQRLADPTRPWAPDYNVPGSTPPYNSNSPQWNPYRTIDAMTVDLTTFDGLTSAIDPLRLTAAVGLDTLNGINAAKRTTFPATLPPEAVQSVK